VEFLSEFGASKLYRQHAGFGLGVLGIPREATAKKNGEPLLEIGQYEDRVAFYEVRLLDRAESVRPERTGLGCGCEPALRTWTSTRVRTLSLTRETRTGSSRSHLARRLATS